MKKSSERTIDNKPAIRLTAKYMGITLTDKNVGLITKMIKDENNSGNTIQRNRDINTSSRQPRGIMQYIKPGFGSYNMKSDEVASAFYNILKSHITKGS